VIDSISLVHKLFVDSPDPISAMILIKYGCYFINNVLIFDVRVFLMPLKVVSGFWKLGYLQKVN